MTNKKSTNSNLTRSKPKKKKINSNSINKDQNYLNEAYNIDKNLYNLGGFTPMPLQIDGLPQTQFISPQLANNITVTPQMQASFDNATAFAVNQNPNVNLAAWSGALGAVTPTIQMIQGGVQMSKLNDQSHVDAQLDALANTQYNDTSYTDLAAQRENNTPQVDNVSLRDLEGSAKDNWKKAGSVIGAGASAGAMAGSFAGPIGTVIGAGIGAIAGGITAGIGRLTKRKKAKDKLEDYQTKNAIAVEQANNSFERSVNSRFIKNAQQDNAIYAAYGGLFNRFDGGGYTGPIYVDPDKVVQSYVSTAPTKAQRFKNRATMIGGAFADFLPSKEDVTTDIVANKFVPKVSNKLGIVSKIVNVPDTVAKIENLKKAFNLPYSEGLIEAGKGKTLLDYTYTKNKFNDGGPKNKNTNLDVSIPKDRPRSVKKNLKFLQNWANSPVTQELWRQNEIDTAAFEDQKELNRTNNKIKRLEEIIEEDKKHYGSAYKEGNSEETLELNKLRSEELTSNIDEAKNIASQKSMDEVRSDMTARLQSSFDAPLYIYEGNKEWGIENMTEKEKEDYQKLKNKVNKLYKESSKQGGLGGSDTKTKATIASYRNEDILKSNPLHEFLHPGWSGTTKTMSAPSLKMEQILREEGLYEDDYWDSGDESYSRLMDFRLLNNLDPKDRKWTEERVNTELKNKGYKMLDRYGAKVISRLLNEVAYNNPSNLDIEIPEQMEYININPNDNISFAAEGGPIFREFNNGITIINEGDTHENNPHEGVQIGVDPEGTPNLVEEGEVIFNDYVFSNRLIVPNKVRNKYKLRNNKELSFADAAKDIQKMSEEMPNDPIVKRTMELRLNQLMNEQEMIRNKENRNNTFAKGGRKKGVIRTIPLTSWENNAYSKLLEEANNYNKGLDPEMKQEYQTILKNAIDSDVSAPTLDDYKQYKLEELYPSPETNEFGNFIEDVPIIDTTYEDDTKSWKRTLRNLKKDSRNSNIKEVGMGIMQAAPVLGSLASVINDIAGGNKPDYTNVDSYEAAINNAYKPIKAETLNDYMEYNPYDPTYELNRLAGSQAASRNALMNTSNGNPSALRAAILASDYNYGNQIGDTYRKALEANDVRRQKVSEFNRGTNQFNAQAINAANQFNAQQAANKATALGQVAQWRNQIHNANRAEKSANLTGLLEGIAGLGETFMNLKDRKYLRDNNVILNKAGNMNAKGGHIKKIKNKRRLS